MKYTANVFNTIKFTLKHPNDKCGNNMFTLKHPTYSSNAYCAKLLTGYIKASFGLQLIQSLKPVYIM